MSGPLFPPGIPAVSVIIPVYNRQVLVREAVTSVLNQTFRDFEIIVVDDGSEDGTPSLVKALAASDPRVRRLRIRHSGFPGRVRNIGAGHARAGRIAFLDSDDLWLPEKLQRQIDFFTRNPGIRICHTREKWVRGGKEVSQAGQNHRREGYLFGDALKKCIIGPSTVMMERTLFEEAGGFREDLEIAEDYELWLRITCREEVGCIDDPLVIKRAGEWDQLSEKYGHIELFRIRGLKDLADRGYFDACAGPEGDPGHGARRELSRKCRIYAAGCRKRGRIDEAEEYEELARRYGGV